MSNILIIGANSAIAKQCARIWAKRNDNLYLVSRNQEELKKTSADLKTRGAFQVFNQCIDLTEINNHPSLLENIKIKFKEEIDLVLIAHGTLSDQKICEKNIENTLKEININAISTISLLTLIANYFEKRKKGTIAIISSVAGDIGKASNYIYGSAKAMVATFASGLRQRLNKSNISVITIKLGFVDTPMTASFKKGVLWSSPKKIAKKIISTIDNKKDEVYLPFFWKIIIIFIKLIPQKIFKKLNL